MKVRLRPLPCTITLAAMVMASSLSGCKQDFLGTDSYDHQKNAQFKPQCGDGPPPPSDSERITRRQLGQWNYDCKQPIHLAVVWDESKGDFFSGAKLAADEINKNGGIAGQRLILNFTDEAHYLDNQAVERTRFEGRYRNAYAEAGTAMAKDVLADSRVSAVIGHMNSEASMSAMLAYQEAGVLMLAGGSTDPRLVWTNHDLYFQLRPDDKVLARKIANAMNQRNWHSGYVVYEENSDNENLSDLLTNEFAKQGICLRGTVSIMPGGDNSVQGTRRLRAELAQLSTDNVDAIVLLAPPKLGAAVIRQGRDLNVLQPFIGTGAFETPEFANDVGSKGLGTLVTSLYRKDSYQVRRFTEHFNTFYSSNAPLLAPSFRYVKPVIDEATLIGYDSVRLYAEAVASAKTTDSFVVARALQYKLPIWYGLLGPYVFQETPLDENGNTHSEDNDVLLKENGPAVPEADISMHKESAGSIPREDNCVAPKSGNAVTSRSKSVSFKTAETNVEADNTSDPKEGNGGAQQYYLHQLCNVVKDKSHPKDLTAEFVPADDLSKLVSCE